MLLHLQMTFVNYFNFGNLQRRKEKMILNNHTKIITVDAKLDTVKKHKQVANYTLKSRKYYFYFIFMCMNVLLIHVRGLIACNAHGGQKTTSDPQNWSTYSC